MREFFGARSILCDNGQPAQLLYYLIRDLREGCTGFGAEVIMHRDGVRSSASALGLTTSRARIREILFTLSENSVTPCSLQDILADMQNL